MPSPGPDAERVSRTLQWLAARAPDASVTDAAFAGKIRAAHRDGGMPDDAEVSVVRRRPVAPEVLRELSALCTARFGRALPDGLTALLQECDGIFLVEAAGTRAELQDEFYEPGLMSAEHVLRALREVLRTETHPDGRVVNHHWPMLPFFEVPDLAYYALDFSRVAEGGEPPVIDYDFEASPPDGTAHCKVIAPSFGVWLQRWLEAGLDPYFAVPG